MPGAGAAPRSLLRRMLLGPDGAPVRGRRDERALDRAPGAACASGEAYAMGTVGRAGRRGCLCRRGGLDGVFGAGREGRFAVGRPFAATKYSSLGVPSFPTRRLSH